MGIFKKNQQSQNVTRVNYEDHSLKFLNWVDRLGLERSAFGRLLLALEEKFRLQRVIGILLFSVTLAYALNFELQTPMDFQVGDIAPVDVVSPISFEMVDQVTTEEKRVKAEAGVPLIFDYDPSVFERVSNAVYRSFRLMRTKIRQMDWPKSYAAQEEKAKEFFIHKGEFDSELGAVLPDYLFEWLVMNRFNARIENQIIKNLSVLYELKIVESTEKLVPPGQNVVLARTINKNNQGREFNIRRSELASSTVPEAFDLGKVKIIGRFSSEDIKNIESLSKFLIYPNLTLNKQEIAIRQKASRDSVLPITVSIKKNQAIVNEGQVVQPLHMSLINQIQAIKSDRRKEVVNLTLALVFFSIIVVFWQYLRRFSTAKFKVESKDLWVMCLIALFSVVSVKLFLFITEAAFASKFGSTFPSTMFLYMAPVAAAAMLVGLLIPSGEVVWLFTAFLSIIMGFTTEHQYSYLIVTFVGGIAAARGVYNCKKRNDIYIAGLRTGIVNSVIIALMLTITRFEQPQFLAELLTSVPAGFLGGILSSMVAMMVIPVLESVFNYTTDVKLLELSNLNHPLLKEMIVKSPGTYHHSMLVGSMVEAAAEEIGANPLLGKVMCYYHDIGKMEHSNYFIENQKPGHNPHDHISPYMSKTLLIAHVKDGVELGFKYRLGKPIIDGIIQHHGTTLISYFYNKALDAAEGSSKEVSEEEFRYPGPKPQFREAALCMLADSIEAAARSLDEPTPVRLQNIVRNIIQRKFMDGQLDECSLTLKDLSKVESSFTRILLGIYHQRIDYPRASGGGAAESSPPSLFAVNK